jgi:hypothetical protein
MKLKDLPPEVVDRICRFLTQADVFAGLGVACVDLRLSVRDLLSVPAITTRPSQAFWLQYGGRVSRVTLANAAGLPTLDCARLTSLQIAKRDPMARLFATAPNRLRCLSVPNLCHPEDIDMVPWGTLDELCVSDGSSSPAAVCAAARRCALGGVKRLCLNNSTEAMPEIRRHRYHQLREVSISNTEGIGALDCPQATHFAIRSSHLRRVSMPATAYDVKIVDTMMTADALCESLRSLPRLRSLTLRSTRIQPHELLSIIVGTPFCAGLELLCVDYLHWLWLHLKRDVVRSVRPLLRVEHCTK